MKTTRTTTTLRLLSSSISVSALAIHLVVVVVALNVVCTHGFVINSHSRIISNNINRLPTFVVPFSLTSKSSLSKKFASSTSSSSYARHNRFNLEPLYATTLFNKQSSSSSSSDKSNIDNNNTIEQVQKWTQEQLDDFASSEGIVLTLTTLGPAYRVVARAKHNTTQIIGYVEGFIRPGNKILHLDKMQVFKKIITLVRKENPIEFKGGGTRLGIGLLLGYQCLLYGQQLGCSTAEFLAINDEAYQHKRLVKYYTQGGFDIIRYVGDDLRSIPDRLIWGGCGTLLRKDISYLLQFWSTILEKSVRYKRSRNDDYVKLMKNKI